VHRFPFKPIPETPLVSVILTSYNYDAYVGQAIQSVYAQTYRPLELIIVDDGSTDGSGAAIEAAVQAAPLPTRVIFKEQAGQASALNAGFEVAQGDWVSALDSDDYWQASRLASILEFARTFPDGGVYQHQLDNGFGQDSQPLLLHGDLFERWLQLGRVNLAIHQDLVVVFVPTSGLFWRKEVLDRLFPVPEQLVTCCDAYLTRCACIYGPLYSYPGRLGTWREHDGNAGKRPQFGFHRFWVPVVMPTLNAAFRERGIPIRFTYQPLAVLWEPVRLVRDALARRRAKARRQGTR